MSWLVRRDGSPQSVELPSAQAVLEAVGDGDYEPADEVRGPGDAGWRAIEAHPQFAEAVEDMDQPERVETDDSKLDMNPLIDVALVLLIFFILTATYTSLRRAIELPPGPPDEAKGAKPTVVKEDEVKDVSFRFRVWVESDRTLFKLEDKTVLADEIERAMVDYVRASGRKQLLLNVGPGVEWGEIARVIDAAKGADIHQINWVFPPKK